MINEKYNKLSPFEQGFNDAKKGYSLEHCPYNIAEEGYQEWMNGHNAWNKLNDK